MSAILLILIILSTTFVFMSGMVLEKQLEKNRNPFNRFNRGFLCFMYMRLRPSTDQLITILTRDEELKMSTKQLRELDKNFLSVSRDSLQKALEPYLKKHEEKKKDEPAS
jgi:hypothetical protein